MAFLVSSICVIHPVSFLVSSICVIHANNESPAGARISTLARGVSRSVRVCSFAVVRFTWGGRRRTRG